ncbi:hypothetical protein CI104_17980 [Citrobacter farmeri]|uniref:Uncharacterized protein n=1 Tax=Citrobacter farmeri TaxID=67824 RepID=A0ACA8D9D0_9ENTR|nr:hypothetical protein CI104_17980 [Citrobacter farmeri]RSB19815.1 hypothetical protein EGK65_09055 [Citrobacter farmeri]
MFFSLMPCLVLSLPCQTDGIAANGAETIKLLCDLDRYFQGTRFSDVVVMPPCIYSVAKTYFDFSGAVEE